MITAKPKIYIKKDDMKVSITNELLGACMMGNKKEVEYYVEKYNLDVNYCLDGHLPIIEATKNKHLNVVKYLISKKAKVNVFDLYGRTPLMYAVKNNDIKTFMYLNGKGAKVNHKDSLGWTALHYAARYNYQELVLKLLYRFAKPDALDIIDDTPLDYALLNDNYVVVNNIINFIHYYASLPTKDNECKNY